jgi:hypothetical protein
MSLKSFVTNQLDYQEFVQFLETEAHLLHLRMENAQEHDNICRLQGQLFMLRRLQKLREWVMKEGKNVTN